MPIIDSHVAGVHLGDNFNGYPEFADDPGALFALRLHSGNAHLLVRPPVFSSTARITARPDEFASGPFWTSDGENVERHAGLCGKARPAAFRRAVDRLGICPATPNFCLSST
jgi:hypothetical protein